MDAGKLNKRLEVLGIEAVPGSYEWQTLGRVWGAVVVTEKKNLFSSVGIGARDATITLRERALSLHQALRLDGQHFFLTQILEESSGWLTVRAALVDLVQCSANVSASTPSLHFPAVRTEKYLRHDQGDPMDTTTVTYVLVTPKDIELKRGSLVAVDGEAYQVLMCHDLDPYKNEYEVRRKRDV